VIGSTVLVLLIVLVALATRYGSAPEKMMAWSLLVLDQLDHANHLLFGPADFAEVDPGHLLLSALGLVVMLWVALRANRAWPLPLCSLQLITLTGHLAVLASVPGINMVYWAMSTIPQFIQLLIVAIGIAAHARRLSRIGRYRDWRRGLSTFAGQLEHKRKGVPA
jgi:hypothetical protein